MKVLNLDELAIPQRGVKIQGKEYAITEMSVGGFIGAMQQARKLEERIDAGEQISAEEQMTSMVDAIAVAMPSCPKEVLETLTFEQLGRLVRFVNGDLDAEIKKAVDSAAPDQPQPTEGAGEKKS